MKYNIINKIKDYKTDLNKTFVLNSISTVLLQGISLFAIPLFSRLLGSTQYGLYAIFNSWVLIFCNVMSLSMYSSMVSGRFKFKDEYYSYRNSMLLYVALVAILVSLVCLALYPVISKLVDYNIFVYILLLLTAFSLAIINAIHAILIYEKKALLNLIVSVSLSAGNVILSIVLICTLNLKELYIARVLGFLIPYFIFAVFFVFYFSISIKSLFSFKYFKFCVMYGLPLVGHTLAGVMLAQADRIMMNKLHVDTSYIGIYSLFFTFVSVLSVILYAFNNSFVPFYTEYIENHDNNNLIIKSTNYIELFTIVSIGFVLLSREVSYIFASNEYYDGIDLIPFFALSIYLTFMYHFPVNYEFFYGKTKAISFCTICANIINIVLNYFLIIKYGMFGAAIATLISHIFQWVFHYCMANIMKENKYIMTFRYFAKPLFLFIISLFVFYRLKDYHIIRWIIGIVIGLYEVAKIIKRRCIF